MSARRLCLAVAPLKCIYLTIMSIDPSGTETLDQPVERALQAFDITFDRRLSAARA